jgi:hypothetical protein
VKEEVDKENQPENLPAAKPTAKKSGELYKWAAKRDFWSECYSGVQPTGPSAAMERVTCSNREIVEFVNNGAVFVAGCSDEYPRGDHWHTCGAMDMAEDLLRFL